MGEDVSVSCDGWLENRVKGVSGHVDTPFGALRLSALCTTLTDGITVPSCRLGLGSNRRGETLGGAVFFV